MAVHLYGVPLSNWAIRAIADVYAILFLKIEGSKVARHKGQNVVLLRWYWCYRLMETKLLLLQLALVTLQELKEKK
jgi:hypothetical protein